MRIAGQRAQALFLIVLIGLASCQKASQVCFKDHCVHVEIAQTDQETRRGLQQRSHLPDHHGMLFVFPRNGTYAFWMKDTQIPLDIIWLSEAKNTYNRIEWS